MATEQTIADPEVKAEKPPVVKSPDQEVTVLVAEAVSASVPTTAEVTPPSAPTAPVIDPQTQARIAALEKLAQTTKAKEDAQAVAGKISQRQQELESYGLDPERALALAQRENILEQRALNAPIEAQAKVLYAAQLADQHKVPVASLMQYNNPDAMKAAAERLAAEGSKESELVRLREENARLKKDQVPPQTFDNGRGQGSSGGVDYAERLRSGKPLPPSREIDAMTAKFLNRR